ncbi:unnamed protein product [Calypogeia fissa]
MRQKVQQMERRGEEDEGNNNSGGGVRHQLEDGQKNGVRPAGRGRESREEGREDKGRNEGGGDTFSREAEGDRVVGGVLLHVRERRQERRKEEEVKWGTNVKKSWCGVVGGRGRGRRGEQWGSFYFTYGT